MIKSKDELYVSVILEGYKVLEKRIQEGLLGVDVPEEKTKVVFFSFVDHCLENREYFRITQYFLAEDAHAITSQELAVLDEEADSTSGPYGRMFKMAFDFLLLGARKGSSSLIEG